MRSLKDSKSPLYEGSSRQQMKNNKLPDCADLPSVDSADLQSVPTTMRKHQKQSFIGMDIGTEYKSATAIKTYKT